MRTNIVLDDDLIREAQAYSRTRTKRALLEEALKTYIATCAAQKRVESYRTQIVDLDRKLSSLTLRERPMRVLRGDRERT